MTGPPLGTISLVMRRARALLEGTTAPVRMGRFSHVADSGKVCLQVRYGTRVLDLARGKNSIEVGTGAELITVLQTVKTAVEAGELDAQIEAASAAVRERFAH